MISWFLNIKFTKKFNGGVFYKQTRVAKFFYKQAMHCEVITSLKLNSKVMKYDISIVKNYLNEDELKKLERLVISFLDYAEDMAEEHQIMTMNG